MIKLPSIVYVIPLVCSLNLLAAEHAFAGMWRPDLERTMEKARTHPEFTEEDEARMQKMLPQFFGPLRMQLDGAEILMKMGSSRQQRFPYEVVSSSEDELVLLLNPPQQDTPIRAIMTRLGENHAELRIEGNNDLDIVVWMPAESMDAEDLNVAAVVAGAMGGSETPSEPSEKMPVSAEAMEKKIQNNLRVIQTAALQSMLENGTTTATYKDLEGEYFKPITPVNGESYKDLVMFDGKAISVTDKDGNVYSR